MLRRNISDHVREALLDRPVVLVNGARQTGKTTLVQSLVAAGHQATYVSLDEAPAHAAAYTDPAGFLSRFEGPVILDEIQRAPELFLAIKVQVDRLSLPHLGPAGSGPGARGSAGSGRGGRGEA